MQKVVPCLWFDGDAEEAVGLYVSLVPNSRVGRVMRSPVDTPSGKAGTVLTIEFTLGGSPYLALNGGRQSGFSDAVSIQVYCDTQEEVDRLWAGLGEGGQELACSWLRDRWGLAWQIVPVRLMELIQDPDPGRAKRAMEAMMGMVKIDIAELERVVAG
jgi:predicted 3-demethylubiquinone-9 3-methyltransferase (glyoxalase superfamily)